MTAPSTRRTPKSKAASRGRPRSTPPATSTRRPSRPAPTTGRRNSTVLAAGGAGGAVALLEAVTGTLGNLWLLIPVAMLLVGLVGVLAPVLRAGRAEQDAEAQRLAELERAARHQSLSAIDAMSGSEFEGFIAGLCHRDGFTILQHGGGAGDLGADVVARAPDGRRIVIQCKRYKPGNPVPGPDLQRFLGTVRAIHNADVPIFVTTAWRFTKQSRELAASQQVVLIDRDLLSHWNNGINLDKYLPAVSTDPR